MKKENLQKYYNDKFYDGYVQNSFRSAEIILKLLYEFYRPESVIDFGCGRGSWLLAAEKSGIKKLKGIDGDWVKDEDLLSKNIDFLQINFEREVNIAEKYDLCISLEVAEHISESLAEKFIENLCAVSEVIIFSAAVPLQGGENHLNEKWQSYWVDKFVTNGYRCFDIFRNSIWKNEEVAWWYRQNILLFIKNDNESIDMEKLRLREKPILDIIHPEHYQAKCSLTRTAIKRYLQKKFRQLLNMLK